MSRKHLVFHIFLLEPASAEVSELTKVLNDYLIKQEE